MSKIIVNKANVLGKMKPVHSMIGIPSTSIRSEIRWNFGYFEHMKNLGTPYSRYDGVGGNYGGGVYVDVSNIFKNFDADYTDPKNYDFGCTDWLVRECYERGVKPIFRLGETIEKDHWLKTYKVFPPKDFKKWAFICDRIIQHYNKGWACGYKANIIYWEIWSGPDYAREIKDNACWKGSKEAYFELYKVVANHLKTLFPNIKVGGYNSVGFKSIVNSNEDNYQVEFFNDFIKYISAEETKAPLDFFSWSSFERNPEDNKKCAEFVRKTLDDAGFTACESICGAWNPGKENKGTLLDSTLIGANLISWQKSPVDIACFDKLTMVTSNLFGPTTYRQGKPSIAYYSVMAFNHVYKLGDEIEVNSDDKDLLTVASTDGKATAIFLVNNSNEDKKVEISLKKIKGKNKELYRIYDVPFEDMAEKFFKPEKIKSAFGKIKLTIPALCSQLVEIK